MVQCEGRVLRAGSFPSRPLFALPEGCLSTYRLVYKTETLLVILSTWELGSQNRLFTCSLPLSPCVAASPTSRLHVSAASLQV